MVGAVSAVVAEVDDGGGRDGLADSRLTAVV